MRARAGHAHQGARGACCAPAPTTIARRSLEDRQVAAAYMARSRSKRTRCHARHGRECRVPDERDDLVPRPVEEWTDLDQPVTRSNDSKRSGGALS